MTLTDSIRICLNKYATFKDRAPRSEFWWFWLFYIFVQIMSGMVFGIIGYSFGGQDGCMISLSICSLLCVACSSCLIYQSLYDVFMTPVVADGGFLYPSFR